MARWYDRLRRAVGIGGRSGEDAEALYRALVGQARQPAFYQDRGVADSVEGRFEMLCVHGFLLLRRLKAEGEAGEDLGQALVNLLFLDLDRTLREMGVGDLTVGKRMKTLGQAFYGRVSAYDQAMNGDDSTLLAAAVARNVFGGEVPPDGVADLVATYMRDSLQSLGRCDLPALRAGRLAFAAI